ncbi:DUF488 domain-containing protein [Candidatus Bathyarchaeota archaeon]|nr:DUF488 domain-containing protein [Candidatus Bathyarchaeota archaeon]
MSLEKEVWFIGYGNRKPKDFLDSLRDNRIELLVDIRRFPTSKVEAFRKDVLIELLKREDIAYLWLGDLLGGYRTGGFEKYMETCDFKRGLDILIGEISKKRVCVMCLERKQRYCHRRFIAEVLKKKGFKIVEIL